MTTYLCPSRPGHQALRNNFASSLLLRTWLPYDWTPRSEAYFVFPLAQGTPGKQCGLAATGVYQPSLRSPWLAAIEPTSQHGLDKYPPHVPTIYKNTHLASIEQTVYGPYQGFGRHPFSRVTDTRNQAGQQGQGHRLFLSPD
ncbi:hypothetical protein, partial [Thiolapillus sp.]|uniref:hypothetical protein n=1 Tax=Thiolapillus sp. TaxID=2017437 RepID=UPI003AF72A39